MNREFEAHITPEDMTRFAIDKGLEAIAAQVNGKVKFTGCRQSDEGALIVYAEVTEG